MSLEEIIATVKFLVKFLPEVKGDREQKELWDRRAENKQRLGKMWNTISELHGAFFEIAWRRKLSNWNENKKTRRMLCKKWKEALYWWPLQRRSESLTLPWLGKNCSFAAPILVKFSNSSSDEERSAWTAFSVGSFGKQDCDLFIQTFSIPKDAVFCIVSSVVQLKEHTSWNWFEACSSCW